VVLTSWEGDEVHGAREAAERMEGRVHIFWGGGSREGIYEGREMQKCTYARASCWGYINTYFGVVPPRSAYSLVWYEKPQLAGVASTT
jgi:hypothetical protein